MRPLPLLGNGAASRQAVCGVGPLGRCPLALARYGANLEGCSGAARG